MKAWSDFFIQKPVFSISLTLCILFVGIIAFFKLPIRLFPNVEVPVISINVNYPGATADTIKSVVTDNIQSALAGINDLNYITSSSTNGNAKIDLHFKIGVNSDLALSNVMEKVASVRKVLPNKIDDPVITKSNGDNNPILLFAFTSRDQSRPAIADYLSRVIKPELESVNGVAEAKILGSRYAMRIWLNPNLLAAYQLSPDDIISALQKQNIQSNSGSIEGENTNFNIELTSYLSSPEEFNNIVIKNDHGKIVRLKDIGMATLGSETDKINAFYKGNQAVMLFLKANPGTNPLKTIHQIEKMLPSINNRLPKDIKMHEIVNASTYINASIKEVIFTLLISCFIVSAIIFLFIGSFRGMIIPLITIPISLIGMCFFLWALGFSLNLLTLLAMVIAIGLVVDDAIVVMENIHRYIEKGANAYKAALQGSKEIAFTIICMTITLAVIYIPIALSTGLTGKLFTEFAISLAGVVIISGIVALTLSPLMCSKLLNTNYYNQKKVMIIHQFFEKIVINFEKSLSIAFKHKKIILIFSLFSIILCAYFYSSIPKELSPKEDEGFLQVLGSAPDSTNSHFLQKNTTKFDTIYHQFPDFNSFIVINGIPDQHKALSFIRLKNWNDRKKTSMELAPLLQKKLNRIAGLNSVVILPSALPGAQGFPIEFVIKSLGDYKSLYQITDKIEGLARKSGLFLFIDSDLHYDQPILKVHIDRNAANLLNVPINKINDTLSTLLSDNKVQYFIMHSKMYEVIPKSFYNFQNQPELLNNFEIKSDTGNMIPLSALIHFTHEIVPESLNQFQKFNSVTLTAVMTPGHTISEGLNFLSKKTEKILPSTMRIDYSGESRDFVQQGHRIVWIYFSALFFIFLVLAMLFESFRDSLIILMGSLPLACLSALIPLKLGFATINIYSQIGLLTLAGLICKHGILITKFANQFKLNGYKKIEAIKVATKIRFRPIVMTTCCIIFGSLPLLFSHGPGNVARFNIGIVIIVGMLMGTVFTLYFLPVFYYYFSSNK